MHKLFILVFCFASLCDHALPQNNLEFYLGQAKQNNPEYLDFQNKISSLKIDSLRLRSGFGVQLNAVSDNYYAPVVNGWGYDEIITNGANINARIVLSKEVTGKSNRKNQFDALEVQRKSILNQKKILEQDIIKNITEQYITTYGFGQEYSYNKQVTGLLSREKLILQKLTEENIYKQSDFLIFLVTLQQQEIQLARVKNRYQNNLSSLNFLCGIEDTAFVTLDIPRLSVATIPEIRNSVFYQSFINDSLKYVIENKQIDFSYRPKFSVFGDAGYNSSMMIRPYKNFGASAGINLKILLYDGKQKQLQHDKNSISRISGQLYRTYFFKQYNQQINQLFQQLNQNNELSVMLKKQSDLAKNLVESNQRLLESGEAKISDYIIYINNYLTIENTRNQNEIEKYNLINQINYWSRTK